MDPKWCQNVTQDGSFHGTEDGVCGYLSDVRYEVAALLTVKQARDHLPIYKLDLPDPILGVPEI